MRRYLSTVHDLRHITLEEAERLRAAGAYLEIGEDGFLRVYMPRAEKA